MLQSGTLHPEGVVALAQGRVLGWVLWHAAAMNLLWCLQGNLTDKKTHLPRTLP